MSVDPCYLSCEHYDFYTNEYTNSSDYRTRELGIEDEIDCTIGDC